LDVCPFGATQRAIFLVSALGPRMRSSTQDSCYVFGNTMKSFIDKFLRAVSTKSGMCYSKQSANDGFM
jgi:hypothetical protein